jgi:hypothetical protein
VNFGKRRVIVVVVPCLGWEAAVVLGPRASEAKGGCGHDARATDVWWWRLEMRPRTGGGAAKKFQR